MFYFKTDLCPVPWHASEEWKHGRISYLPNAIAQPQNDGFRKLVTLACVCFPWAFRGGLGISIGLVVRGAMLGGYFSYSENSEKLFNMYIILLSTHFSHLVPMHTEWQFTETYKWDYLLTEGEVSCRNFSSNFYKNRQKCNKKIQEDDSNHSLTGWVCAYSP